MDKYKLKNMSDELSMQEIESLKDFKGVLGSYKSSIRRKIIYQSLAAVFVAAAAGVIIYISFLDQLFQIVYFHMSRVFTHSSFNHDWKISSSS